MRDLKGKKILIIAAGAWQVPVIKKARDMGLTVISTDRDPHAPGFSFADYHEVVDITDLEGTLEVARRYRTDAVITEQTDVAVPTAAYVAEKLGLSGIGYEVALKATNKFLMREACIKAGIPMPKYSKARNLTDALNAAEEIGYPVVIKPVDSQSSRGVFVVQDPSEIKTYYDLSVSQSRERNVLLEEKLSGVESTAEGFVAKNGPIVLAISEKKHLPFPHCIATTLLYAPSFDQQTIDLIKQMDLDIVKTIGIPIGITHAEFIITEEGPRLVEIAARGGGTRISSHIVPGISGVNIVEGLIMQACGYDFEITETTNKVAILDFFIFPEGKVKAIEGIDDVRKMNEVMDIDIQLRSGDVIKPVEDDRGRHGYFIALADTKDELYRVVENVRNTVKVTVEPS